MTVEDALEKIEKGMDLLDRAKMDLPYRTKLRYADDFDRIITDIDRLASRLEWGE